MLIVSSAAKFVETVAASLPPTVARIEHRTSVAIDDLDSSDAIVLDTDLKCAEPFAPLLALRSAGVAVPVVLVAAPPVTPEMAIRATAAGAYEILPGPPRPGALLAVLRCALGLSEPGAHPEGAPYRAPIAPEPFDTTASLSDGEPDLLLGRSPAMIEIGKMIGRAADLDVTVMLTGESGTGKELVAQRIHRCGSRSRGPFVAVNCAAIPEPLLESELFGHEKGAFTGAVARIKGRWEAAQGGTLFLDEIGDMSLANQKKILRALETRTVERVGGSRPIPVDTRVIAASHQDLQELVRDGRFRRDLYYRLVVLRIDLPPLRTRPEDVRPLAEHFIRTFSRAFGRPITSVVPGTFERLAHHPWPGNVRELRNVIERSLVAGRGPTFAVDEGMLYPAPSPNEDEDDASAAFQRLGQAGFSLESLERSYIQEVLEDVGWHFGKAAERLEIHRNTLRRKIHQYDISRQRHA